MSTKNLVADRAGKVRRDLRNRAAGAVAEVRSRVIPDGADDTVVTERVRAAFGRVASHPSSILVSTCDGEVTLSGPVLASEVKDVIETVRGVRGVGRVVNELEVHDTAEGIPGLQGAGANQ